MSEPFQVGTTLKRTIATFFANFVPFNLLGLLVGVPGLLLIAVMVITLELGIFSLLQVEGAAAAEVPDFDFIHVLGTFGIAALGLSIPYLIVAMIVHGTLQHLRGDRPRVFGSLKAGLRRAVPVIFVSFIVGVLFFVGWMFVVVPGVIVALMFCVAVPVVMAEQGGVLQSLSRSRALTRGQRWRILGLFLLALVLTMLGMMLLMVPIQMMILMLPEGPAFSPEMTLLNLGITIVVFLLPLAMQLFMTVFFAVLLGVLYHDLRVAKEGVSTDQIVTVFD